MARYQGRYIILTEDFPDNPKIAGLSDAAFRAYVESLCYTRRHRRDGDLGRGQLRRINGGAKVARELRKAGLWEPSPDAGYTIHDFLVYQNSEEYLDAIRQARSDAGKKGAEARYRQQMNGQTPQQMPEQTPKQLL